METIPAAETKASIRGSGSPVTRRARRVWLAILAAGTVAASLAALALALRLFESRSALEEPLGFYGSVPDFTLTERSGRLFSSGELRGRPWIANFMFTACQGQCPRMSYEISRLQKRLPAKVRFVSFTVNPEKDSPAMLADYAGRYGAEENRWFFLTGEKKALLELAAGFHLTSGDDPSLHSVRLVLVDGEGRIRGYYDPVDAQAIGKVVSDTELLLRA